MLCVWDAGFRHTRQGPTAGYSAWKLSLLVVYIIKHVNYPVTQPLHILHLVGLVFRLVAQIITFCF